MNNHRHPPFFVRLLTAVVFGCALGLGMFVTAAEEDGVTVGRQALQGQRYPWYDAKKDEPRSLAVAPYEPSDVAFRNSNWEQAPSTPTTPTRGTAWPPLFSFSLLNMLGLSILLLALGIVIYFLVKAVMRDDEDMLLIDEPSASITKPQPQLRIADLPIAVPTTTGDFLAEVRRHAAAGDFNQAIIYFYSYLLLQLDRHEVIRLAKGKTNRQYLRETKPRPELRNLLEPTMIAFEDVFFGRHQLDPQRFENCWSHVEEFHRLLERPS